MIRRFLLFSLLAVAALAQRNSGELRISVVDPAGLGVGAQGELTSGATAHRATIATTPEGKFTAKNLPFGTYHLTLKSSGFETYSNLVEIRSEIPKELQVRLGIAPIETAVVINDAATLLDTQRTGTTAFIGSDTIRDRTLTQPGRGVLDLVQSQPGWLLEANGVLHPRGSEYQVQYVVDGLPITDNRSPGFAPSLDVDDVQSMNILTANYPAEYGRKLGGIVEVNESKDARPGFHGKALAGGGSFGTVDGYLGLQYGLGRSVFGFSLDGAHTDRYLDPPVQDNFTNRATSGGGQARFERDLSDKDRLTASARWNRSGFEVPNERVQEDAGQRQDRNTAEAEGQIAYQRILSPSLLLNVRAMGRDLSAGLWSNPFSTPIQPQQDRGFRNWYANSSVSGHWRNHEWKAGADAVFDSLREQFGYRISDPQFFDPQTPPRFSFSDRAQGREQAAYVQDLIHAGRFTFSLGLRWDHYRLLVSDQAVSPRLGVAYWIPSLGLVLRASYDRAFQTPAIENLLLASSVATEVLNDIVLRVPVPPSRGNFYQAGFSKSLSGKVRLDATYFRRNVRDFADDDVLLNTGVSFPISFSQATIQGFEVKVEMPRWGPWSGFVSYSNQVGTGQLPITGGLFLSDAAAGLLSTNDRFAITQDQRNTASARVRFQPWTRGWFAAHAGYGSGLPVELGDNVDLNQLREQYGDRVLARVNFDRGRVRPSFSLDLSAGVDVWKAEHKTFRVQADVINATDRLNVINFASLFSGTALAQPRAVSVRTEFQF